MERETASLVPSSAIQFLGVRCTRWLLSAADNYISYLVGDFKGWRFTLRGDRLAIAPWPHSRRLRTCPVTRLTRSWRGTVRRNVRYLSEISGLAGNGLGSEKRSIMVQQASKIWLRNLWLAASSATSFA
jgi:hypothetical protein